MVKIKWDTLLCSYPFLRKDNIKEPPWSCRTIRRANNWTISTEPGNELWWAKRRYSRLKNHIFENWTYTVFLNTWPSAEYDYKKMRQGPDGQWAHIRIPSNCSQAGPDQAGAHAHLCRRNRVCYSGNGYHQFYSGQSLKNFFHLIELEGQWPSRLPPHPARRSMLSFLNNGYNRMDGSHLILTNFR